MAWDYCVEIKGLFGLFPLFFFNCAVKFVFLTLSLLSVWKVVTISKPTSLHLRCSVTDIRILQDLRFLISKSRICSFLQRFLQQLVYPPWNFRLWYTSFTLTVSMAVMVLLFIPLSITITVVVFIVSISTIRHFQI